MALAALACGACAQSAADNEHGPAFTPDGSADATQDSGAPDEGTEEAPGGEASVEGGREAGGDSGSIDASAETSDGASDAGADVAPETGDAGFVAPTCDGVIGTSEYGHVANQQASNNGQVWYMTWDATNLYVAISGATVAEGSVIYLAVDPADGGAGLTSGYLYDRTDVTSLPFAAALVVYAKQSYDEVRAAGASSWGLPDTTAVRVCTTGATSTNREEVIPWSLVGGLPRSFGWTAYLAANPMTNLSGYVYGQMPVDDPGGADAGGEAFTRYYAVPNAAPGVDTPFADEQ